MERLSDQDAEILALERGNVRGHTVKVVIAEAPAGGPPPDVAALAAHVEARLGNVPRLRQRIAPTPLRLANPAWVDDADFAIENHVSAAPPEEVDARGLRRLVAEIVTERLDRSRPLWHATLVPKVEGGRFALVLRIHHAMADGISAMRMLQSVLVDDAPAAGATIHEGPRPAGNADLLRAALADRAHAARAGLSRAAHAASPRNLARGARALASLSGTVARELGGRSDESPLDRPAGPNRAVAFAAAKLEDVKRTGHALVEGATVNDVVLTAVGGGLRRLLGEGTAASEHLRVQVPVSLHHHEERPGELGNRDSFMFVDLALEEEDPVRRLRAVSRATAEAKRHHDAEALRAFFDDLGHVSRALERVAERWAVRPRVFALNVSNVPGPRGELSVLGAPVREVYSLAEIANRHALRVAVVSASGRLGFGLTADPDAVHDVDLVATGLEDELAEMGRRAP